jgi:hypothetical protein
MSSHTSPTRILFLLLISITTAALAGPGDTTVVQTFTFDLRGDVKEGKFLFPAASKHFEKILMYYTLKCTPDLNPRCGEWDYIAYTNLYQHTGRYDSTLRYHANFMVNRANRDTLSYITSPAWTYFPLFEQAPYYPDPSLLRAVQLGAGSTASDLPFPKGGPDARTLMLWNKDELTAAGLTPGTMLGIRFRLLTGGGNINGLRIRMKSTALATLDSNALGLDGFTTVYQRQSTALSADWNTFRFSAPFQWDGTSNIVVELSFVSGGQAASTFAADNAGWTAVQSSSATDYVLNFAGKDLVDLPASAFSPLDTAVTVSFWQYGNPDVNPANGSIFEAYTTSNARVLNMHLPWGDSKIYWDAGNASGYDRVEKLADSVSQFEGRWNHWAVVKSTGSGQMKLYVNGVLWTGGINRVKPLDPITKFHVGGGAADNNFYSGMIDDFAVWNIELKQKEIRSWMNRSVDNTHPNWANLVTSWHFDEGQGGTTSDVKQNASAQLVGRPEWTSFKGNRVKNFTPSQLRPQVVFEQGDFATRVDTNVVIDSVRQKSMLLVFFSDSLHPAVATDSMEVWPPYHRYSFDASGKAVDSVLIAAEQTLVRKDWPYYDPPYEVLNRFELGRFITPYGINLDLGSDGWTWIYDVSDFRPLLADSVHLSAGNWQELLDLKFVMIEGEPPRDVVKIENLWQGNWGLSVMESKVTPRTITLDPEAKAFKLRTCVTGHGMGATHNCAEFCPNIHSVDVDGATRWSWQIIQDCALNPLYPQGGTWIYPRAGWCPGMPCTTNEFEITPFVTGPTVTLDYNTEYDPDGNYVFESQLVSYGAPRRQNDAAITGIMQPSTFKLNSRLNPSCARPRIVIRNNGALPLTQLDISYGVKGSAMNGYHWTGSLVFLEQQEVQLPTLDMTNFTQGGEFTASLSNPNGVADEYEPGNTMTSQFAAVPVYTSDIIIILRTNTQGGETSYQLLDATGTPVFSKSGLSNSTYYRDTLHLADGCYEFVLTDEGDNGLSFFANNDGTGSCILRPRSGNQRTLNPDFGRETRMQFIHTTPSAVEKPVPDNFAFSMFPNPAMDAMTMKFTLQKRASVRFELYDNLGRKAADIQSMEYTAGGHSASMSLANLVPGSYHVVMLMDGNVVRQSAVQIVR